MNLLLPAFLGAAALVGLPLIMHLLRIQPRARIPFPSLWFLGGAALKDSRRHSVRRWLTFLLRCLIILLLALAFSRPFWPLEHTSSSRAVVVVVDNSYSMQAAGRIEAVEAWLKPQIESLRPPDELGVLVLQPSPEWLVPLGPDIEAGLGALTNFPRAYETSNYRDGLALAATALKTTAQKQKQILLAGDQQKLGWSLVRFDKPLPGGVELLTAPCAEAPKRQAAVNSLKIFRTAAEKLGYEAVVMGYSSEIMERTLTFYQGEEVVGVAKCSAGNRIPQVLHGEFAVAGLDGEQVIRAVLDPDELTVDDVAYAVLPARNDRRIMLEAGSSLAGVDFLRLALKATQGGRFASFRIDPLNVTGAPWPLSSVAILRGSSAFTGPGEHALNAFLQAGGSAWLICNGSPEQQAWLAKRGIELSPAKQAASSGLRLRDLALDHPLFAAFGGQSLMPLLEPAFRRGWAIGGASVVPLARWPDRSVAIAEVSTGLGRILITGFGETRADSDFPLSAAYVPVVHRAICWLAENDRAETNSGRVGEVLALPGKGIWRPLNSPVMAPPLAVEGLVDPSAPGIYEFDDGLVKQRYAVNLETSESDLAPWPTPGDFSTLVSKEKPAVGRAAPTYHAIPVGQKADERLIDERGVWWWLIAGALVLLVFEFALANRTIP